MSVHARVARSDEELRTMKQTAVVAAVLMTLGLAGLGASDPGTAVSGDYVEVRTAEVFTGPCMLGNEAYSLGREAILAWRVTRGSMDGVSVDGLAVVAVVAGDRNLGMHELGDDAPSSVKAVVMVDARATAVQQRALVSLARSLSPALTREVVDVKAVPIAFERGAADVRVHAGDARLDVTTTFEHSPVCGAMQWFSPLASTVRPVLGLAREHAWSGPGLDTSWAQRDRKASFVGTFSYAPK
jgi:hypothetical protein